ncbi:MAG TPA: hydantoinase/oxoprolinase family protein [Acidimicrobiia bacterium]|nr:hydantoinase/oxoprolinase family protein [Acidimicrobiia bacterium]
MDVGAASDRVPGIPARSERDHQVGADTGGTFTDVVDDAGDVRKVASSARDPAAALERALARLPARPARLAHGTTVATNALLERRGGRVALVATHGFADVVEIARQTRPSLYDVWQDRPEPLVPRDLRFEVGGRLDARGDQIEPLVAGDVPEIPGDVDGVAVCLLHADLDGGHERAVADVLRARGHEVTCSHDVSPEFREYERTVTTVLDAYLRPRCTPYVRRVEAFADDVVVMTSAGGLLPARDAAEHPVALLLSGPAGGVRAAAAVAAAVGLPDAVSFDMGGTSTDVCLVRGGMPEPSPQRVIAGFPVRFPALDVHTIGAGGGSIARIDPGGALAVGPRSAGAEPGPACYGRGGREPTVTDADLALGRIPPDATFPDLGRLDLAAARDALARAGVDAAGVVDVVDAAMERAVRQVTVERGVDPRGLALVAFGGAGPLHACALADALGMAAVVVPPRAGVLSAVGLLTSPKRRELVRSWPEPRARTGLDAALDALARDAASRVGPGARVETFVDCRYAGQSHELTVADVDAFHDEHRRRNGYERRGDTVEVIALRARAEVPSTLDVTSLPGVERAGVCGPAVVTEDDTTVWIPDGWSAEPRELGTWVVTRT